MFNHKSTYEEFVPCHRNDVFHRRTSVETHWLPHSAKTSKCSNWEFQPIMFADMSPPNLNLRLEIVLYQVLLAPPRSKMPLRIVNKTGKESSAGYGRESPLSGILVHFFGTKKTKTIANDPDASLNPTRTQKIFRRYKCKRNHPVLLWLVLSTVAIVWCVITDNMDWTSKDR